MTGRTGSLSCARARVLLEAYVDGDLAAPRAARFEAHVTGCLGCAEELVEARRLRAALRDLPQRLCPEGVVAEAIERARAAELAAAGVLSRAGAGALSCARARALVEAYLDGELAAVRLARFGSHLRDCPTCAAEAASAERVRDGLRGLPEQRCPESVMATVLGRIRAGEAAERHPGTGRWQRFMDAVDRLGARVVPVVRPAIAAVSVAALALTLFLVARPHRPALVGPDVARAELEVKWVMAYLGEMSRRTGSTVREDVRAARVVTPMTHAVEAALQSDGTTPGNARQQGEAK